VCDQPKNPLAETLGRRARLAERVGELRPVFQGSETAIPSRGLSLLTCGREWDFVTPRSASRNATGFEGHRRAVVSVDAQRVPVDALLGDGVREQLHRPGRRDSRLARSATRLCSGCRCR